MTKTVIQGWLAVSSMGKLNTHEMWQVGGATTIGVGRKGGGC